MATRASPPQPLAGTAALELPAEGRHPGSILVSDLHLGFGMVGGLGVPLAEANARAMAEELLRLFDRSPARELIVAGDVKHPIVGAPAPVRRMVFDFFSTLLAEGVSVRVVLGNHDVGLLPHLPREVALVGAEGLRRGSLGIFHGHRWPSRRVLTAPRLVAGHLHPGFRLAPGEGGKQRCWVRATLPPPRGRRGGRHRIEARELIVLPAFNPGCGIEALNKRPPAEGRSFLVHRFLAPGEARAYLLDGTDVGRLPSWAATRPRARAPRAP